MVVLLLFIAFLGAVVVALLMWRAMNREQTSDRAEIPGPGRRPPSGGVERRRTTGPDDDPEFLRKLDETVKRREDPPRDA